MKYSIKKFILAIISTMMMGMPCTAKDKSHSDWKRLADMAVPRWEAGSVVLENKLYIFGGYKMSTKACKRVDVFDPKSNSWQKLADLPSAITHINMVLDGRLVWFAGGFKNGYKGYAISEVWRYDIDKNTYTAGPSLPQPRASGGLAILGRKLHYTGGLTMYHHDSKQIDRPLVDIYDPETDSWSRGADLPTGHTHAEAATFVHDKRIWFLGGMAQVADKRWMLSFKRHHGGPAP